MRSKSLMQVVWLSAAFFLVSLLTGCANKAADALNPFAEEGPNLGKRDSSTLLGSEGGANSDAVKARTALEQMGSYRRAQAPQPAYPVIQPAEVRLMWVPDHLNRRGDLVPAHYYYLKVLDDRWAVTDAFELERQLKRSGGGNSGGSTPWVYGK